MRALHDTFLRFLADNLSLTIHPVRRTEGKPDSDKLHENAVNVRFMSVEPRVNVAGHLVSIDVIHQDELTALDWVQQVWDLLSKRFFTPKFDYTNPAFPVATGTNIMWAVDGVGFRAIHSPYYAHYSCLLRLEHQISS